MIDCHVYTRVRHCCACIRTRSSDGLKAVCWSAISCVRRSTWRVVCLVLVVFHQGAISENEAFVLGVEGILTEDELSETLRVSARRSYGACFMYMYMYMYVVRVGAHVQNR